MKRFVYIIISLLFCCNLSAQERAESIRQRILDPDTDQVIVCAHRGDWRNFPENSLEAIQSAISLGVDIVEIDLQMTKDSVLILMHDATLDRTSTGHGKISEKTIDYIRTLNLRNGCGIRTGQRIPTLEEALLAAKGKVMLNLDKADRYFDQVYQLLIKTGTSKQIIMKGGKSPESVLKDYSDFLDKVIYMPIVNLDKPEAEAQIGRFLETMRPAAFELLFKKDSNPLPLKLKHSLRHKSLIWYNTLWDTMAGGHDDDASLKDINNGYGYLIDHLGARIIQTDRPGLLLDYLKRRNLHD